MNPTTAKVLQKEKPTPTLSAYRCILNYYPINSETILWGNSEIAPLEINPQ